MLLVLLVHCCFLFTFCFLLSRHTAAPPVSSALTLSALLFALLDLLSEVLVQMSPMGESLSFPFFFFLLFFWKTSVPALTVEALSEGSVTWCCYRAADRSVQPHWVFRALQATWLDTHNKGKSIDHRDESCHSGFFLVHYNDFLQTPGEKKLSQFFLSAKKKEKFCVYSANACKSLWSKWTQILAPNCSRSLPLKHSTASFYQD